MPPALPYNVRQRVSQYTVVCLVSIVLIGCGGGGSGRQVSSREVTFNKDIAPIVYEHCSPCHRPGQLAPFGLLTYAQARARAERIARSTTNRSMPPWLPERGQPGFANERSLTDAQIALIDRWVRGGALEGDAGERPPAPSFTDGWQLGQPDLVLQFPEPYSLAAGTSDTFRNFVIPLATESRRYVRGVEFRPGPAAVIHHAVIGVDRTRASRRLDRGDPGPGYEGMFAETFESPDGFLTGWTPGRAPAFEPFNMAWPLDPGVDLVVQLHLMPVQQPVTVAPQLGLFFSDMPPSTSPTLLKLGITTIELQPGERDHVVTDQFVLPVDCEVLSVYPHAHYLAKEMQASAKLPDGSTRALLSIKNWDFMWQDVYRFRVPERLPRGSMIQMRYSYDNSAGNPHNPRQAPAHVVYGPRSSDEMGDLWLQVRTASRDDGIVLGRAQAAHRQELALRGAEHMVQTNPKDAGSRNLLGAQYLRAGRIDDAIGALKAALAINPRHAEALNNLGLAEQANGRETEAIQAFRLATTIKQDDDAVHLNLANALNAAARTDEAVREWQRTLVLNPDSADAHNNLGRVLGSRGRVDDAIAHFERALAIDPGHADAHNNLAVALGGQGKIDEAIAHARRALEIRPDHADAKANLEVFLKMRSEK